MSLTAAAIRVMAAKGLTAEDIADVLEAMEAAPVVELDAAARKRLRDAERMRAKREEERLSRDVAATVVDTLPLETKSPPTPPKKTQTLSPSQNPPKGGQKGSRLPENWEPEDGDWLASVDALGGDVAATNELDRFRDYWRAVPGAKGLKLDWPATWRNWVRRASENQKPRKAYDRPGHHNRQAPRQDRLQRLLAGAMAAVDEREHGLG